MVTMVMVVMMMMMMMMTTTFHTLLSDQPGAADVTRGGPLILSAETNLTCHTQAAM